MFTLKYLSKRSSVFILFSVSSENNAGIIERVIAQALHEHGGQERCPWTRAIMEGTCTLPFIGNLQSNRY